jgi:hypothetical protein
MVGNVRANGKSSTTTNHKTIPILTIWPNYVYKYILLIVVTFIPIIEYIGLQLTVLIVILVLHI